MNERELSARLAVTKAIVMARIDRAKLRAALGTSWVGDPTEASFGGIELRVNRYMPEGIAAMADQRGNILGIIDLRGDHDPSRPPAASDGGER